MNNEKIIEATIEYVVADLGLSIVPEVIELRNYREQVFGHVNHDIPNTIFIDIAQINKYYTGTKSIYMLISTICHEARHLWQIQEGWEFNNELPLRQRPHEIDAENYETNCIADAVSFVIEYSKEVG